MTDVEALKKCIADSGMTIVHIANKSGILRETLYNRMNGNGDFKVSEVCALTRVLNLNRNERDRIFFDEKSELKSTTKKTEQEEV